MRRGGYGGRPDSAGMQHSSQSTAMMGGSYHEGTDWWIWPRNRLPVVCFNDNCSHHFIALAQISLHPHTTREVIVVRPPHGTNRRFNCIFARITRFFVAERNEG